MDLLNILLLLTASLACASANETTYGERSNNTVPLAASFGYATSGTTVVTFNHDKRYALTIHMVTVSFIENSVECNLVSGGPLKDYLTLDLSARNAPKSRVEISIFGVMNKKIKGEIDGHEIKFTELLNMSSLDI